MIRRYRSANQQGIISDIDEETLRFFLPFWQQSQYDATSLRAPLSHTENPSVSE